MRPYTSSRFPKAFTLVELLVVIGIIGLLISILMPSLSKAKQAATNTKCLSNLRSMGQAISIYVASSKGLLPPGIRWGIEPVRTSWHSNTDTNWSLVLQGMLNRKNSSSYTDMVNNPSLMFDGSRAPFSCPDAPITAPKPDIYSITNNLSYACHPLFFGGQIYATGSPYSGPAIGAYTRVLPQFKMGSIKRSSEALLIVDSPIVRNGEDIIQYKDNPGAYLMDGGLMLTTNGIKPWTYANLFSASNLKPTHPLSGSIDMTAFSTRVTDCNTDSTVNGENRFTVRFRHKRNTGANALMADGHAESFTLNKTRAPNDPQKTDLLRKYIYQ